MYLINSTSATSCNNNGSGSNNMTQKYTDIDDENDGEGHERNVLLHQSMVPMPMWKVTAEINPEGTFKIGTCV